MIWLFKNRGIYYKINDYHCGLAQGPFTYNGSGLATCHNADFLQDPDFIRAYQLGAKTGSWQGNPVEYKIYVCCWAASQAIALDGDFVECGVYKGGMSLSVINYVNFINSSKTFFLLDTFEGIPEHLFSEAHKKNKVFNFEPSFDFVSHLFKEYKNVKLIKGEIPFTLNQVTSNKISYLSIDMNHEIPEIEAITYFWEKIVHGGIVILDDYGHAFHIKQKIALDNFSKEKGFKILTLPTGQGLIVKI